MRTPDGRIVVDLGDNVISNISGSITTANISDINENATSYVLLPERINVVPYISSSIYDTSLPQIKPIQFNDPGKKNLFIDAQGVVKVAVGSYFILKFVGEQPPIFNIENGIPTMYQDQTQLAYVWQRDGVQIGSITDYSKPNSFIQSSGSYNNELVFSNVSPQFAGTYTCTVANDIGTTESEPVTIEVYNPDVEDLFYKNVIENPYGKDDLNGWSTPDQEFITNKLTSTPFKNLSQPWSLDLFGYSVDMFYPRPYHINTYHIRNSDFAQEFLQEGSYFTREKFKYKVKGGKATINASYDVDLTNVIDYIQGSIYGVTGVRAIFGCYIGNAITKYRVSLTNALIGRRSYKYTLLPSIIRLSIANSLLAGIPFLNENVRVHIQEFDGETPLMSLIKQDTTSSYEPGYVFRDRWTETVNSIQSTQTITSTLTPTKQIPGNTNSAKILYAVENNLLYPNPLFAPTYGQYVGFNRVVLDQLNFRTNKIRITVVFDTTEYVLGLTDKNYTDASEDCFEYPSWEPIQKPNIWPTTQNDYYIESGSYVGVDYYNIKYYGTPINEPFLYATQLGFPRAMATGFNLILVPIQRGETTKLDYYTKNILAPLEDNPAYTDLIPGSIPSSPLGIYFSTLRDYEYEIIGVNIENIYNQPTSPASEFQRARGETPTRTVITTYKYDKTNTVQLPEPLNFSSQQSVWQPYALFNDPTFAASTPAENFVVLYNSGSSTSILDSNLEQVIGNITTRIIDSTNNLITDVPGNFATMSYQSYNYLNRLGFLLNLTPKNRGILTTQALGGLDINDRVAIQQADWATSTDAPDTSNKIFEYRLLPKAGSSAISTPNTRVSQHIVYSDYYFRNFNNFIPSDNRFNLKSLFVNSFTSESRLERGATYRGVGQSVNDDLADDIAQQDLVNEEQNGRDRGDMFIVDENGNLKDIGYRPSPTRTTRQVTRQNETIYIVEYTVNVTGSTADYVMLDSVIKNNVFTPTAIVIPNRQKVYYFVYNYVDNARNERV